MKKIDKQGFVELIADKEKVLTTIDFEGNRIFASACSVLTPDMWEEWTDEQMEQWQAEHPQEEEPIEEEEI